ncbi:major facilitator superfamily domain-containing protein [Xylariaceae sp. FL1019]|nr:major facilitator superfamily domain-containing protein [Xylariaceae sp. FL1019]
MNMDDDTKPSSAVIEHVGGGRSDNALPREANRGRVALTEEDSKRICRKTDKVILAILVWAYFLQILDKTVLGYGALFGLQEDTGLTGNQYSFLGSIAPIAMLIWQPFSSVLIVKVPHRILMPSLVLGWGIAQTAMAACHNNRELLAARFFLGLFEAGCLPLFSVITSQWYRRAEQPIRVAAWYGTNGLATIVASALSYGLGHIPSESLKSWQIIFLFVGLVTIVSVPFIYWKLDNDIPSARFLTEHEKEQATERLRANQTGLGSKEFKFPHVVEICLEPKTCLWIGMTLLVNVGAAVTNTFGPLILNGLGYNKYLTSLLNIPFGALQLIVILLASWAAQKAKIKSITLDIFMIPVVVGLVLLYVLNRSSSQQGPLLLGYYFLAFLFGANPLIVSWIVGNTGGTTKKSVMMSLYSGSSAAGNIIGPLLFSAADAPAYHNGLRSTLAIFVTLIAVVAIQAGNLIVLNKLNRKSRVRAGKKADIKDHSMNDRYVAVDVENADDAGHIVGLGKDADLTDGKNNEFVYIY